MHPVIFKDLLPFFSSTALFYTLTFAALNLTALRAITLKAEFDGINGKWYFVFIFNIFDEMYFLSFIDWSYLDFWKYSGFPVGSVVVCVFFLFSTY